MAISAEERRARNTAAERRKREQRAAAGACRDCGAPLAVLDPLGGKPVCSAMCRNPSTSIAWASCIFCRKSFAARARGTGLLCRNRECRNAAARLKGHSTRGAARVRAKRQAAGMCPQCGAPMEELGGKMVCSVSCKARRMTLIAYACCMFCREVFVSRSMGEVSSLCRKPECQRKMAAIRNKRHTPSPAAKERARAGVRAHGHARRAGVSDITPEQEMAMRAAARNCPLCGVRMTDVPYLPNSKHLDHIVPINQGGTHTLGNVRILCCRCNVRRPADGSDYTGPLTLWAQIPATSRPVRRSGNRNKETCRSGLHPWTPENIVELYGQRSCGPCIELHRPGYLAKAGTNRSMIKGAEARMETARQIRAMQAGGMSLREIARQLGYRDSKPVRNMLAELAAVEYA